MAIIPQNTYVEENAGGPGIMGVEDAVKGYSIFLFINIYLINNRMLQILQRYHAGSRVDGPPQVTVAPSFFFVFFCFIRLL